MEQVDLRLPPLLACAMSLALAGCFGTSRPSRFYTLEPLEVRDGPGATATDATLAVGPVELQDYVDRPQIVTRSGTNELVIAEFALGWFAREADQRLAGRDASGSPGTPADRGRAVEIGRPVER